MEEEKERSLVVKPKTEDGSRKDGLKSATSVMPKSSATSTKSSLQANLENAAAAKDLKEKSSPGKAGSILNLVFHLLTDIFN